MKRKTFPAKTCQRNKKLNFFAAIHPSKHVSVFGLSYLYYFLIVEHNLLNIFTRIRFICSVLEAHFSDSIMRDIINVATFFYIAKIFESVEKILKGDLSMHPHRYNFCTVDLITFDALELFYKMGYERFSTLIYRQVVRMKVCSVCQLRDIPHLTLY